MIIFLKKIIIKLQIVKNYLKKLIEIQLKLTYTEVKLGKFN